MDRTQVELECPGTRTNYTVIVSTAWQAQYGIGKPANVGTCTLFLAALDAAGRSLEGGQDIQLKPGESRPWYHPPAGAAKIVAVCSDVCHGTAVLEYDTPVG